MKLKRLPYFCLMLFLAGCVSKRPPEVVLGPVYQPSNIYTPIGPLPLEIRRVAVLPLASQLPRGNSSHDALERALHAEFSKTGQFELVRVSLRHVREWTGQTEWPSTEPISARLLETLRDTLNCDAVLLAEITHFNAYPPLLIGWNLKLIGLRDYHILWAADEVFDAGKPSVANAARIHQMRHAHHRRVHGDSKLVLLSPAAFGRYTAEALASALPGR